MRGIYEKVKGSNDWYICYVDSDGHRHREHVGRQSVAIEAYVNKKREIREGRYVAPKREQRVTFQQLAERMLADKEGHCRRKTSYGNRTSLSRLFPLIGSLPAAAIGTAKINEVLRSLRTRKPAPGRCPSASLALELSGPTLNNYRALLNSIFAYGIANGYCAKNPVAETRTFENNPPIIRYLTADEEAAIRAGMRDSNPDVDAPTCPGGSLAGIEAEMDLALNTGLRSGEQFLLTWDLIDLERGILTVPKEGKTGRRFIPINSACRAALLQLHEQSNGSAYVCYRTDSPEDRRSDRFRAITAKAGVVNFRWHDLRHTFASRLVMAGVDLRTVQQFLGHTTIVTTMRYAHLSPEHGKAAIEKLVGANVSRQGQLGANGPAAATPAKMKQERAEGPGKGRSVRMVRRIA